MRISISIRRAIDEIGTSFEPSSNGFEEFSPTFSSETKSHPTTALTEDEIHASALQFVRKLSGFNKPSQANAEAFEKAVSEVSQAARTLLVLLHTAAPVRDRAVEAEKARARARERFAPAS